MPTKSINDAAPAPVSIAEAVDRATKGIPVKQALNRDTQQVMRSQIASHKDRVYNRTGAGYARDIQLPAAAPASNHTTLNRMNAAREGEYARTKAAGGK